MTPSLKFTVSAWLNEFERRWTQASGDCQPEPAKLAAKLEDRVLAEWVREMGSRDNALALVHRMRGQLRAGAIDRAFEEMERRKTHDAHLLKMMMSPHLKASAALRRGGRPKDDEKRRRDIRMARSFLDKNPHPRFSESALKADIGRADGLGRSAAIEAINRGLKILSCERD